MDLESLLRGLGPVQDTMKDSLKKADAERARQVFEGSAGGGAVKARLTGALTLERVTIAPAAAAAGGGGVRAGWPGALPLERVPIAPAAAAAAGGDVSMLEDLVQAAVTDALRQYRQRYGATAEEQMQKLMSGSDLSAMLGPLLG